MPDYILQADPGGNCCDCPARSGPCDNCAACQCLTLSFSSVSFGCGCIDNGDGSSTQITDSTFNGQPALAMAVAQGNCCAAPDCFNPCAFWTVDGSGHLQFRSRNWFFNNTCNGAPTSDGNVTVSPLVMFSGGKWWVLAGTAGGGVFFAFFSGSSSSLGTITNDLVACGVQAITNPIFACFTPGSITSKNVVATGGTAALAAAIAGCGACCIGHTCVHTTAAACAQDGGTYHGDGTSCTMTLC